MTTTLGKYTLVKKLATGGMAEVFLARADGPMGFAKKCVVKRILPHFNDDPRFTEMFLGEARLAADLNHPNLVQIFDFGEADGQYFLAMEYIDGPNVRVLNKAVRRKHDAMDFSLAARIVYLAAEGLHFAHELRSETGEFLNLVHRDISPDNILVARNGGVKVVDFGIAKASTQPHLTKSGMIKGKMAYMPPEQLAREPLDRRSDLFALGMVLYELVTGGMPFDATSEVSIIQAIMSQQPLERATVFRPDCPPALEAIITKCLEKDRTHRYASCRELQADLELFLQSAGKPVGTREVAELVADVIPKEPDATPQEVLASEGLERTVPEGKSAERKRTTRATDSDGSSGTSDTSLREVPEEAVEPNEPPSKVLPIVVGLLSFVVLGLGVAIWWFSQQPKPLPRMTVAAVKVVDAGRAVLPRAPVPVDEPNAALEDSGVALEPVDAGPQPETPPDAGAASATPIEPRRFGKLNFRIRPYATVYMDDKLLGDTPLPPLPATLGKHRLRLVNPSLGTVVLDVVIRPGDNVVKHNFKE